MAAVKTGKTEHKTTIKIGHASGSEGYTDPKTGETSGIKGKPGDQTGYEVVIVDNYSIVAGFKPNVVLRPKSRALAKKSALACEAACNNPKIGYSQYNISGKGLARNTAYDEAKKVDFDLAKIANPCNTDCSAFMTLCAVAGGASFSYYYEHFDHNAPTTAVMRPWFTSTNEYEALTDDKYITITDYLKRGDVLVDEDQHTVMVLENGCKATDISDAKVLLTITNIKPTKASVRVTVTKLDSKDELEEQPLEDEDAELYTWECVTDALDADGTALPAKQITLKNGLAEVSLTGLVPNRSYILKVVAKDAKSEIELSSANMIFTTPFDFPTSISKLNVKFGAINELNTKCTITFNGSSSWGSTKYKNGYRIYLIVNGKAVGYSDSVIQADHKTVDQTILLKEIAKDATINYDDILQIGIQPWLKEDDGNIVFDSVQLSCSQPICNKHFMSIIDKVFIKIKDAFKQAILHNTR